MKKLLLVILSLALCLVLIGCDGGDQTGSTESTAPEAYILEINFHANGGEGTMPKFVIDGGDTQSLPLCTFTKENYAFVGWATSATGDVVFSDGVGVLASSDKSETLDLYAVWGERKTTIVFMNNGGSGTMSVLTVDENTTAKLPKASLTREGYKFLGWSTDMHATTASYSDEGLFLAGPGANKVTLYAIWEMKGTRITFDPNGGVGSMGTVMITALTSSSLPLCEYTKDGYAFSGWATSPGGALTYTDGATYSASAQTEQITLYAVWQKLEPKSAVTIILDVSASMGDAYAGSTYFETAKQRLFSYLNDDRLNGKIVSVIVYDQDSALVLNPIEKLFSNDTTDILEYRIELAGMVDSMDRWFYGYGMDNGEDGVNNREDALGNPVKAYGSNLSIAIGRAGSTISFLATTEKDIVLITGTMPQDKGSGYEGIVARMQNAGICFSTIMIGEANAELEAELKVLCEKGKGKYIYTQMFDADDIFNATQNKE